MPPDLKCPVSLTSADSLPGDASGVLNHVGALLFLENVQTPTSFPS